MAQATSTAASSTSTIPVNIAAMGVVVLPITTMCVFLSLNPILHSLITGSAAWAGAHVLPALLQEESVQSILFLGALAYQLI